MPDWGMGVSDPRAFYQGSEYVDRLYNAQAQKAAGALSLKRQEAADARTAAGDARLAKADAQSDADRKAEQFKTQHAYLQRAVPVLTQILQKAGPQKLLEAYDQLGGELQQMGIPPDAIQQYRQSFMQDPQGTLQTLAATAQRKFTFQKRGDDVLVFDEADPSKTVAEFAATPKAPDAPSVPSGYAQAPGGQGLAFTPGGPADPDVIRRNAEAGAEARRDVIIQNPLPSNREGAFRNLTPAEIKERGYKPGTRAQINDVTGQVNVLQSPNDMDLRNAGYANRVIRAEKNLTDLASKGIVKPTAQIIFSEANGVTRLVASNQKDRQFIQAAKEWLAPILRKDTGAAVTDTEFDYYSDIYIPRPEDGPEVLEQKRQARATAMESIKAESGQAYGDMFGERDAAERAAPPPPAAPMNVIRYDTQGNRVK